MQDPSIYTEIKPQFPEQEHLKCPRCDSENTKFCYYNNYNLSQPRHYCKSCRRYWTKGGSLRNIPVGGASRKNTKRSSSSSSTIKRSSTTSSSSANSSSSSSKSKPKPKPEPFGIPSIPAFDNNSSTRMLDVTGPFSSLMASTGPQFGNFLEALNINGPNLQLVGEFSRNPNSNSGSGSGSGSDAAPESMGVQNGWNGGWADLAIYTPGSNLQ